MALGDVFRFTLIGEYELSVNMNVLHYEVVGMAGTGATPTQILNGLLADVKADYLDAMNAGYNLTGARLQQILPVKGDPLEVAVAPPEPGTVAGDGMPGYVSAVISLRTGIADRSHRGRIFLPARSESDSAGSVLNAGALTLITTAATTLVGPITQGVAPNTSDMQLTVFSKLLNNSTPVEEFLVRPTLKTQRRRMVGRGI